MKANEITFIITSVLKSADIETSSDFICAAYQIAHKLNLPLVKDIEYILPFEIDNCSDVWYDNVLYTQSCMMGMSSEQYQRATEAYKAILSFFLMEHGVSKVFKMDSVDHTGWQIYRELDTKYLHCKTFTEKMRYVESKNRSLSGFKRKQASDSDFI